MKKKIAIEFAQRLMEQRKKKEMLQVELSQLCGFSKNYVGMLERAEKNVTLEKVYVLAIVLECAVEDLIPKVEELEL